MLKIDPYLNVDPGTMSPLEHGEVLVSDNTKDTPITITLKAYAKENPEKVVVYRKATFIYPRLDKLQ